MDFATSRKGKEDTQVEVGGCPVIIGATTPPECPGYGIGLYEEGARSVNSCFKNRALIQRANGYENRY